MNDKKQINSELKHIAIKMPYNKAIIKCANIFQMISLSANAGLSFSRCEYADGFHEKVYGYAVVECKK